MFLPSDRKIFIVAIVIGCCVIEASAAEKIDFNRDIRPILSGKCFACHGPDEEERGGDVRLDTEEGAKQDMGGYAAVVAGDPEASEMIYRVTTDDDIDMMPPEGKGEPLSKEEVALLSRWIEQGGKYAQHWSYQKPQKPEVPETGQKDWKVQNEIDPFIHRRLISEGLEPAPEADRYVLARRVALDVTGLPPTWEETKAFVDDNKAGAYERFVDAQLAKPTYGERWAAVWLDLARYADSAGYADDPPRTIWAYRDWVIRAYNENIPFDQFTIDQIAGDLVAEPSSAQLIATAFHRNTMTNNEGGTNDEEFRNVAVVDRVNTTMEVWMGTTMACAQCHTHKYDPLTHAEYFQLFDFFNQSADADKKDESPLHEIWTNELKARKVRLEKEIEELNGILKTETPAILLAKQKWLQKMRTPPEWNSAKVLKAASDNAELSVVPDDAVQLVGEKPKTSLYQISIQPGSESVSGIRLRVSPEQTSNFVLSQVEAIWRPEVEEVVVGRFVRVVVPGEKKFLHLAEVEAISDGKNVALGAAAKQSSVYSGRDANLVVDGKTDGDYKKGSVSHTQSETDPWLEIDLGAEMALNEIRIWNRNDGGTATRLSGYRVEVLDAAKEVVSSVTPDSLPDPDSTLPLSGIKELSFAAAFADYEQKGFPASSVISEKLDPKKGWAVGGATGKEHELTLVLAKPLKTVGGTVEISLPQKSVHANHLLTSFRIETTGSSDLSSWAEIPGPVRKDLLKGEDSPQITNYYLTIAKELQPIRSKKEKAKKALAAVKPVTVPIMQDLPAEKERDSFIHIRGNYKSTGDQVHRGVPAVFHPLRDDLPRNRLALAHWLVDSENPLAARVLANRIWQQIFGYGIVHTSEEFGSQGEQPTHPELLDWLAVTLQESGWDQKAFIKRLLMSATYRQSSVADSELVEDDPFNQLYARGPRFRIAAEMVRDQALFVSGLLSDKMYGPPVNPPQPELGLKAAFGGQTDWKTSSGEDKFRRGLYTTWRRSSPYASMATFDAPNREVCSSRRIRTNTPLQALVTLNDPVYIEAAQALARAMIKQGNDQPESIIRVGWRKALLREPTEEEISKLVTLYQSAKTDYAQSEEHALEMATNPLGEAPPQTDIADLAAWTVVGNVILNLDELFLNR